MCDCELKNEGLLINRKYIDWHFAPFWQMKNPFKGYFEQCE